MASWDKEVLSSLGLFGKHEGKGFHFESEWKSIHLVGAPQTSKEDHERRLKWKQFKKYFKQKYLSDRYYDDKIKEFHELKLGQLTMEE